MFSLLADNSVIVRGTPEDIVEFRRLLWLMDAPRQQFRVRLFNDRGQFLKESEADFTLGGPGKIEKSGLYQAPNDKAHTATIVTAKVGDVTGQARVRVVPPLP